MLTATLREFMGSTERFKQVIDLDRSRGDITIGRSESCTYQIGKYLGKFGEGISRVQATIEFKPDSIVLVDGSRKEQSKNRVWVHGAPIDGEITLYPGLDLTLFKAGGKVSLVINDPDTGGAHASDTYTGHELLGVLQEQVTLMAEQNEEVKAQVAALAEQLAHRNALDDNQEQRLLQTEKRLNRMFTVIFGSISAIVLIASFLGGDSDNRKLLTNAAATALSGGIAIYFEKQRKELGTTNKSA